MLPSELFEAARPNLGPNFATGVTVDSETGKIGLSIALPLGKWSIEHPISDAATPENATAAWGLLAGVAYLEMLQLQEELLAAYTTQLPKYGTKSEKAALSALTAYYRVGKHLANALRAIIEDGPERDAVEEAVRAAEDSALEAEAHAIETERVAPPEPEPAPVEPAPPEGEPAPEPVPAELPIAS